MREFCMPVIQVARKCFDLLPWILNRAFQLRSSRHARFRGDDLPQSWWRGLQALLLLLPAALIAIPSTAQTIVGTKFPIASGWVGVGAAFDGNNFLVPLQSDLSAAKVAAQLVSPRGTKIGSTIALGHDGESSRAFGVAFDGTNYLVAWEEDQGIKNSSAPLMVYGQFLNASGARVGQAFAMTSAGISFDGINMLAYGGGKYLLTYTRLIVPANGGSSTNRYVVGRIVSPDSTMGNEFRISEGFGSMSGVAFDGLNFFVVWKEDSQDYEVRGRFVSPRGTLGQEISINASPAYSDNVVTAAFDGTNYMVVWTDRDGTAAEGDVFGQRVSPNGTIVGGAITITSDPGMQLATSVTFDGANHLVVWVDMRNDANRNFVCDAGEASCWDSYGQYVGKDGALVGSKFPITTDPGNQAGTVTCAGGKCLAIVSSSVALAEGGGFALTQVGEVYGAFVASQTVTSDCLFSWAERAYPYLFAPAGVASATYAPYYFRYYSSTSNYLATSFADNHIWLLGPISGNALLDVGPITSLLSASGCSP